MDTFDDDWKAPDEATLERIRAAWDKVPEGAQGIRPPQEQAAFEHGEPEPEGSDPFERFCLDCKDGCLMESTDLLPHIQCRRKHGYAPDERPIAFTEKRDAARRSWHEHSEEAARHEAELEATRNDSDGSWAEPEPPADIKAQVEKSIEFVYKSAGMRKPTAAERKAEERVNLINRLTTELMEILPNKASNALYIALLIDRLTRPDPDTGHTDIVQEYTKARNVMMAVASHIFTARAYYEANRAGSAEEQVLEAVKILEVFVTPVGTLTGD